MPYLPVEFDALEKCQHIARATDAQPGDVLFGLALTWRDTFREHRDKWTVDHLRAFFGCKLDVMLPLLVAFGFFEPQDDQYRVKGASRLLRARDAQRAAAAKTNAAKAVERTVDRTVKRRSTARLTVRSEGALTAYSKQHTAISKQQGGDVGADADSGGDDGQGERIARIAKWHADAMRTKRGVKSILEDISGAGVCAPVVASLPDDECEAVVRAFVADDDPWLSGRAWALRWLTADRANKYLAATAKPADKWAKSVLGERW